MDHKLGFFKVGKKGSNPEIAPSSCREHRFVRGKIHIYCWDSRFHFWTNCGWVTTPEPQRAQLIRSTRHSWRLPWSVGKPFVFRRDRGQRQSPSEDSTEATLAFQSSGIKSLTKGVILFTYVCTCSSWWANSEISAGICLAELKDQICEAVQGAGEGWEGWGPCFVSLISINRPGEVTQNI